jgi:hypothetical protein
MLGIEVQILRYVDDHQPGWVECSFSDASGSEHLFLEKAPVVSTADLHPGSPYPQVGIIGCTVLKRYVAEDGRQVVTVDTERPWGIESKEGRSQFDVRPEQLREFAHDPAG